MIALVAPPCDLHPMNVIPRGIFATVFALIALTSGSVHAQVYISEFLAENQTNALVDENGSHEDWIEIWNSGATTVNLNGWYLTDDAGDLQQWRFPLATPAVNLTAGARLIVFASNKNRKLDATKLHTNFKLSKSAGGYLALVQPDGLTVQHAYTSYPAQVQDIAYGLPGPVRQPIVPVGAMGRAKVPASAADMPADWTSIAYDDSTWQSGATGFGYDTTGSYGSLIGAGGNLQSSMYLVNPTALVRIPFNVTNPADISDVRLQIKFDDGYIFFLNGTQLTSTFAPVPVSSATWNTQSSGDRAGSQINSFLVLSLPTAAGLLVPGTNVLSFQMLNRGNGTTPSSETNSAGTLSGSRSLLLPMLEGYIAGGPTPPPGYLITATPAGANTAARTAVGPAITQTTDQPARPVGDAGSAPLVITAKVIPTLNPLAAVNPVQLRYRVALAAEAAAITMLDNGLAPDAIAGDGIFTASIPTANLGVGELLRWRIVATDNAAAANTDPPYLDTLDNEEYFGTVTQDGITTSQIPVMHWWISDTDLTNLEAADNNYTRTPVFYLGRFYDKVRMDRHGQSTAGFAKKSFNMNFSQDNKLIWELGSQRIGAINLLSNWADKSHVRNQIAWETWDNNKHIASHWSKIVRLQRNGAFRAIYDMVENGDEDFLKREGLDPLGALYKVYNRLENATQPAGVEKKTGYPLTDVADLTALENALITTNSLTSRRQYAYDNVDIPSMANYLATNVLTINNDFGHKNYYIYRDTNGTREWSLLPWDQDLSFGHTWTSVQNYFNDDLHSQAGLVLGAVPGNGNTTGNRLMDLMMNDNANSGTVAPEMAQMFLRRIRTIMDDRLVSATATDGPLEQRITQLLDLIDPPAAVFTTDADLDLQKWGYWLDGSGTVLSPNNAFDAATHDHGPRKHVQRILNSNPTPTYPAAAANAEGLGNTLPAFLPGRRSLLYTQNPQVVGLSIPAAQPAAPTGIVFEHVDFNPGNQSQEFFILRNNSASYIDISGWKIKGGVEFTFLGGTVIPPFTAGSAVTATGDVHNGRLHIAREPYLFRQRSVSPKGGEFRLVTGGYSGQLSARGETLNLVIPGLTPAQDVIVASTTFAGAPTPAQNALRVTELAFNPTDPTPAELLALPGVQASDFEFIELTNTGATALDLSGAYFDRGVTFTFPAAFSLAPGQRCVVVALTSAFNLRHGASGALVAGQYEGNLNKLGETLQIVDGVGESVLEFTYDPLWYGVPKVGNPAELKAVQGYSLVLRSSSPVWNAYENPTSWALSGTAGGTPGANDTSYSNVFVGWRKDYFTAAEELSDPLAAPAADADSDGRSNFEEFVFGGNPRVADNKTQPLTSIVNDGGTDYLAVTFERRHNVLDAAFTVEACSNLLDWQPVNHPFGTPTPVGNGLDTVTYRDSVPSTSGQRFIRVRAVK